MSRSSAVVICYLLLAAGFLSQNAFNFFINVAFFNVVPIIITVFFLLILCEVSDSNEFIPVFPLLVAYTAIYKHYGVLVFEYNSLLQNLPYIIIGTLVYLIVGGLWSIVKMKLTIRKEAKNYIRGRRLGCDKDIVLSAEYLRNSATNYVSYNKLRIYGWVVYWPFSIVHSLFGDIFTLVLETITSRLGKVYNSIIFDELNKYAEPEPAKKNL